ncbi:MAG: PAS domain S-box protein [Rhodobacteraceae bacterium]|nr:PAS domain S-box protein [Paracoccaceae bacterium]
MPARAKTLKRARQRKVAPIRLRKPASRRFAERFSLEFFADQIAAAIVVIDDRGKVVFANAKAYGLLRLAPSAVLDEPPSGLIRICYDRARQRAPQGEPLVFENYFAGRWFEVQAYRIGQDLPSQGGPYLLISLADISDRKRREFDTLENMAGLEEATRIAQMGTFRIDHTTHEIQWSPHMYILHGVTPERFRPTLNAYAALVYPEDREIVARNMALEGASYEGGFQYRIVKPDGALRWVNLDRRVLFDTDGEPYGVFGTVQDITETKQREQELQRLLRRNAILYEALEASPIGVGVLSAEDEKPQFIYVNTAFQETTLHSVDTLNPRGIVSLAAGPGSSEWQQVNGAIESSQSLSIELDCVRSDGAVFPALIEIAPVRDHPGKPASAFVINVRDLTADRQRAAVFLQSQKMEALGQLSGGVAHEINNLLQPVIALSDLGRDAVTADPPRAARYLQVIGNSGRKARDIVRQVLTFARRDSPQLGEFELVPLVEDAINLAHKGVPPGMEIVFSVEGRGFKAVCSPTQVSQVVLNLIRNAVDAMNGIGTVEVALRRREILESGEQIKGLDPGTWFELSVKDHGCGIDETTRARVFEPFFTTKPVGKGTGLGLSVVYSIVTGWGGTVEIDSQVDVGTRVMLYIPEAGSDSEQKPLEHAEGN